MKRWWYWLFSAVLFGFILITRGLFTSYKMEGEQPGSLNEFLLNTWWGFIVILLVLLFLKRISEKKCMINYTKSKQEVAKVKWEEVRQAFPEKWVLIEAIQAFTNEESERILVDVVPLKKFTNSPEAMKTYQELHRENPTREFYVLHTSRDNPNIIEKKWIGVGR